MNPTLVIIIFTQAVFVLAVDIRRKIFEECNISKDVTTPTEANGLTQPLEASLIFLLIRLADIDDVAESTTMTGGVHLILNSPCVREAALKYNKTEVVGDFWLITNPDDYWRPPVVHLNSRFDYGLHKDITITIIVFPFYGIVRYAFNGFYTNACVFRFRKFPYDTQHCETIIQIWLTTQFINLTTSNVDYYDKDIFVTENLGWEVKSIDARTKTVVMEQGSYFESILTMVLDRYPDYFMINILGPCLVLTCVQLVTFVLPPDSDRASFSITILLSFTVVSATVLSNFPKTPSVIYVNNIIVGEMLSAMLVVCYSGFSCCWVESNPDEAFKKIIFLNRKVRKFRKIDFYCGTLLSLLNVVLIVSHFILITS